MEYFSIIPALGLKSNVPQNDPTMLQMLSPTLAVSHCVSCRNIDLTRRRNSSNKSYGYTQWSNSANATHTRCLGLFQLDDGANTDRIFIDTGLVYIFNGTDDPVRMCDTAACAPTPVVFASDAIDLYSMIQYGSYWVFTDRGEHTPYKWKHGDTTLSKLLLAGTEYKFRYLEFFQGRIIGAYSDQTNGDLEIRWSERLPAVAGLTMASLNQDFKPGVDSISGIKRFGSNACILYGSDSINSIEYMENYSKPFGIIELVGTQGTSSHHSIISTGDAHFFFNKNYGFCEYRGGNQFPYSGAPISEDIENRIATIDITSQSIIVGKENPLTQELVWSVPLNHSTTNNALLCYNRKTKQWRQEDKVAAYLDYWTIAKNPTWEKVFKDQDWTTVAGGLTWTQLSTQPAKKIVFGNTDGKLYGLYGETNAGTAMQTHRVEPILDFGDQYRKDLLLEIWIQSANYSATPVTIRWRGGDSVEEIEKKSFTIIGTVSFADNLRPVLYTSQIARMHQIMWQINDANMDFSINNFNFGYVGQSRI